MEKPGSLLVATKMKKWVITVLVILALAVAGKSAHWWLPHVLPFLEKKTGLLQGLSSAVQLVLWLGAAVLFFIRLWPSAKQPQHPSPPAQVPQPVPPTTSTALHQLRLPRPDFTGRTQELAELMKAVEGGGLIISGMGGVGKTELALKLADQLTPRYPHAQFYLDLKGMSPQPVTPKDVMAYVIRGYDLTAKPPESEADLSALYRSVLHNQKAILLMDNARDAQQVEPLIPPPSCLLLVTSRQHFALPGLVAKDLEALPPDDARALLFRIAPRLAKHAQDSTGELARLCGYLPQALRTVGSALAARMDLSPADYARRLADARERLQLTATDGSLQLSYDLLAPDLQKHFRALAVFPDTFDAAAAATVWEVERAPAQDALSQLLVYSLVEFRPDTPRYRLHDLVRLFADARLDSAERATAQRRHAEHYKKVAGAADELFLQGGESVKNGLALFDAEWLNIQAGQAWAAKHSSDNDAAAALCSAYPDAGAYCLNLRLHPREHIRWREAALAAAPRMKDRRAAAAHLGNLGLAYDDLGDYRRAIEYHEQALAILREIGDRRGEGNALGNLGIAYKNLGDYPRAIEYYQQRLQIAREISDPRGEGSALGNLGNAYGSLGDYRRAIEYHEQALAILREIGDRHSEGKTLGNLGSAYGSLGEYRRAIEYCEPRLEIAREIGDRLGEGNALWNMSLAFDKLGEHPRAIPLAEAALEIYEQIESPNAERVRKKLAELRK